MLNIVIFGPPGAGKGTQSAKLAAKYNVVHLSTGDILRAERKAGTPLGKQAQDFINKGQLVPDSLVAGVLENEMNKHPQAAGFIFDGFPRTVDQVSMLDEMLQRRGSKLTVVVSLEVKNRDELIRRIVERGKLSDRADDQDPVVVGNRLKVYEDETSPVIDVYKFRNLYRGVNGEHMVEVVYAELCLRINAETAPLRVKGSNKVEAARVAAQERKAKRITARRIAAEKEAKRLAAMEKLRAPLP
ncbi:MAG: adenylate kinase, partial [Bacteroidia bacterium]